MSVLQVSNRYTLLRSFINEYKIAQNKAVKEYRNNKETVWKEIS